MEGTNKSEVFGRGHSANRYDAWHGEQHNPPPQHASLLLLRCHFMHVHVRLHVRAVRPRVAFVDVNLSTITPG